MGMLLVCWMFCLPYFFFPSLHCHHHHHQQRRRRQYPQRNRVVLPPAFSGGPSVIPFGVGEGRQENGVVQIPLHYTVGDTVDFIRTIATVDRDYRRGAPPPAAVAAEGGRGEAAEEELG